MTRGKLLLIYNSGAYISREFNGDMYMNQAEYGPDAPISPGDIARKKIDEVNDLESFKKMVREFTEYYYGPKYAKCELTPEEIEVECTIREIKSPAFIKEGNIINFDNYCQFWFSDYIYMKNASENVVKIMTRNEKDVHLEPGQSEAFCFGCVWEKEEEEDE